MIRPEIRAAHRATWFVYAGGYGTPTEKLRHTATMRGSWAGWDVECSCGKGSHTGGAIKARVEEWLFDHRFGEQTEADMTGTDPATLLTMTTEERTAAILATVRKQGR